MPRVEEITKYVDEIAPFSLAEEWDNVGVLLNCGGDITSILVALDITEEVAVEAEMTGCQLIISHHPVIFEPLKSISRKNVAYRLVKKNLSAICAHTNLDAAEGGVSDTLAALFELKEVQPFANSGRIGVLPKEINAEQLAMLCKERLRAQVQYCDSGKLIRKVAVVGGAGGDFFGKAAVLGADALLTGEVKYHDALDAKALGISTIGAGHFATEFPILQVLANKLTVKFPDVRVIVSRRGKDPFQYVR